MKNKFLKKLFVIFMLLVTAFQNVVGVKALNKVPEPITVVYEHEYTKLGTDGNAIVVRKVKYTDESGKTKYGYAYCLEGGGGEVSVNDVYNLDNNSQYANKITGEIEDDGILYITNNGFWGNGNVGSGKPSNEDNIDFAITQLAIWLYYYDVAQDEDKYDMDIISRKVAHLAEEVRKNKYDSSNATYSRIVNEANKLCEGAKKARLAQVACNENNCSIEEEAKLNVSVSDKNLKLSADGKYLESELITVTLAKFSQYSVSVSNKDFSIVDENGNNKTSFKSGDKIKIRISKDKVTSSLDVSLKFTATYSERVPYQYYGGTYTYNGETFAKQRLLFSATPNEVTLEKKLDFTYKLLEINVEFSKIDVTTGKELPGAHLEIKDSNGKVVESWVSSDKTYFFKLNPGKYTLTETIAPEGYVLATESVEFEVKADGSVTKVVMENKPVEINVEFSKIDVTTGKELPGAHLELRDANGKLVDAWVSSEETHFIKLNPGKYTLTETIAPEGYELATESVEFEVKADGSVTKVVMENKPVGVNVEFSKIDVSTGKELPGAHLEIKDSNGKVIYSWISSDKTHFFKLEPGKYTLTETIAPEGYELATESIEFEVKNDGTVTKVVMENKPYIEVPITSLNASSFTMIIGGILISFGLVVVYAYVKKFKF